jgi:hypothetical protein
MILNNQKEILIKLEALEKKDIAVTPSRLHAQFRRVLWQLHGYGYTACSSLRKVKLLRIHL